MKIVVAGGSGLMGAALCKRLIEENHSLVLLTRRAPRSGSESQTGERSEQWDGQTPDSWVAALEGSDAIINLSGQSIGSGRWTSTRKRAIRSSRTESTRVLIQATRQLKNPPRLLINASAVGYYGNVPDGDVTEDMEPGSDFLAETCRLWEEAADAGKDSGMKVIKMRTGFVLGHDAPAFRRMVLPYKFFAGGHYGSGEQWFPWIHIDDAISAYLLMLRAPIDGPVNITSPHPLRMKEFHRILGAVLKRPSWAHVPSFVLRAVLGETAGLILTGQKALPTRLLSQGFSFGYPTAEEALSNVLR